MQPPWSQRVIRSQCAKSEPDRRAHCHELVDREKMGLFELNRAGAWAAMALMTEPFRAVHNSRALDRPARWRSQPRMRARWESFRVDAAIATRARSAPLGSAGSPRAAGTSSWQRSQASAPSLRLR